MNFLDFPAYVMGCMGIGDIVCSFNALENIGRERGRKIDVFVVDPLFFQRVFDIYHSLDLKLVNLHLSDLESIMRNPCSRTHTVFQAFGMDVSWVNGWLWGWGLRSSIGHNNMVHFNGERLMKAGTAGVSFTVNSHSIKNISNDSAIRVIDDLLNQGNEVIYFGFRKETDAYLEKHFGTHINYCAHDLRETIRMIGLCQHFVGADSGMAWLAAFHRIETRILFGRELGFRPNTFGDIPWVSINHEDA